MNQDARVTIYMFKSESCIQELNGIHIPKPLPNCFYQFKLFSDWPYNPAPYSVDARRFFCKWGARCYLTGVLSRHRQCQLVVQLGPRWRLPLSWRLVQRSNQRLVLAEILVPRVLFWNARSIRRRCIYFEQPLRSDCLSACWRFLVFQGVLIGKVIDFGLNRLGRNDVWELDGLFVFWRPISLSERKRDGLY